MISKLLARVICASFLFAAFALPSVPALAGSITVSDPVARTNLPNRPTAAYMMISNSGTEDDTLLSASSPAFETIEIHSTVKDGGVMKMVARDRLEVPANGSVTLAPGGLHLMLFGAERLFKAGETFMMTLTFEKAGDLMVETKIAKVSGGMDHGTHGSDAHSGHSGNSN